MTSTWMVAMTLGLLAGAAPSDADASERNATGPRTAGPPRVEAAEVTGATAIRLDGDFGEAVWTRAVPITEFVQRDPQGRRAAVVRQPRCGSLYDTTYLYVAVRAFDKRARPDRRHPHAARLRLAVRLDPRRHRLVPRPPHGVRVRREPRRREAGHATGSPTATRTAAGTPSGTWPSRATREGWKAEFRIPFSQLRFEPGKRDTFGFAVHARDRPAERDLDVAAHRRRARPASCRSSASWAACSSPESPKRLELVPYGVAQVVRHSRSEPGNPVRASRPIPATIGRRRPQVRGDAGPDADGHDQPGLRPGRGRPGRRQPDGVRDVLSRSAGRSSSKDRATSASTSTATTAAARASSTRAASAARRTAHPTCRTAASRRSPTQTTIIGAAKLTGRAGAFSIGALNAVTAEEQAQPRRSARTARPRRSSSRSRTTRWCRPSASGATSRRSASCSPAPPAA